MNVVQAMPPMMKYRPRAATIATDSQSGRPLGRRCSCICVTSMSLGSSRQCAPTCAACDSSITTSATLTPCSQSQIGRRCYLRGWGTAQVQAGSLLSVVIRWEPIGTAVNGTQLRAFLREFSFPQQLLDSGEERSGGIDYSWDYAEPEGST